MSKSIIAAAVLTAVTLTAWAATTKDGVFTAEQAERGKLVYDRSCKYCHPDSSFYEERLGKYQGKPVEALFEAVSTTMPADNVGSLPTSEYIDVIAYVFSITGAPAGKSELTADNMSNVQVATQ